MPTNQDPHAGGSLSDWAQTGTKVPNDAGIQNIVPSYPEPREMENSTQFDNAGIAEPTLQSAVDNPVDVPRSTRDVGMTGEVTTGIGDQLPAEVETKNMLIGSRNASAKGSGRNAKHQTWKRSAFDRMAKEDADSVENIGENEFRNRV